MNVAETFSGFINNLSVSNRAEISRRYKRITKCLNKSYWDSESDTSNSLQVGSYGRHTAINGISDLDMVFELPWSVYTRFNKYEGNGQSALLQEVKKYIKKTYSNTDIKGDGQVVVISFDNYVIEVLPSFKNEDGSYTYPDSTGDGGWKKTKPRMEIDALNSLNKISNGNLKNLCKMVRSWKNKVGAPIGGLLIDTLCYNFIKENKEYNDRGFVFYDWLSRDIFKYLSCLDKTQEYWFAPGSNQKVYKKGNFIAKAKKAHNKCLKAIEKEELKTAYTHWKSVYGSPFPPAPTTVDESAVKSFRDTEEYIDDMHGVDIRYTLNIDCEISQDGFRTELLNKMLAKGFPLRVSKKLRFFVTSCNVPAPYTIKWKIRNVGDAAERKDQIRGQIWVDGGNNSRNERTTFKGSHFVECYAIKNNICVARERIDVPISA